MPSDNAQNSFRRGVLSLGILALLRYEGTASVPMS